MPADEEARSMRARRDSPENEADQVSVISDVSVIVCTQSVERWPWLLKCLASLKVQTLKPFEVIVVVRGNADLDGRLRKRHGPERLLYTSAPLDLSDARSLGLTAATGAFVCFLDDDAVADPSCLSILRSSVSDGTVAWASGCSLPMWNGAMPRWMPQELEWTLGNDYRSVASAQTDAENMDGGCVCMRRESFVLFAGLGAGFERQPRGLDGVEAAELYSSIQDRVSALRPIHEPTAIIRQPVPHDRQRPAYVLARCWEEGISKATIRAVTQLRPGLVRERELCHGTVPARLGSYLRQALLGDMSALQKAGILCAAPAITLAGRASESVRRFARVGQSEQVATTTTLDDTQPLEPIALSGLEATERSVPPLGRPLWAPSPAKSRVGTVAVLTSLGLLVVTAGYAIGWAGNDGLSAPVFYVGISTIFGPCAWRLLGRAAHRKERLQVAVILGFFLILAYYLSSPLLFDRYDELLHTTTLWQLSDQRQLFSVNTTLPISPYYPGLELLTLGVHWGTGLPDVASELLAVAASRVVLALSIFLIAERLTRSSFAGGVAVLAYATSTQFFAFNAQFAYQTLALGLALATVHFLLVSIDRPAPKVDRNLVLAVVCLATLTITHHVVSWLTVLWLIVWAISLLMARRMGAARVVGWAAGIGVALVGIWTAAVVGPQLVDYLAPPFREGIASLAAVLSGATAGRELFTDPTGVAEPIWVRLLEIASVIAWSLMLILATWAALKRRSLRGRSLAMLPFAVAVTYPVLEVAHLAPEAAQIAERASTFVFVAMAIVISAWLSVTKHRWRFGIPVLIALVCFLGGEMVGSGPLWSATPGPYLVSADQRSVDAASIAAAQWARGHLPANSHMAADLVNSVLMAAVGHMSPVNDLSGQVNVGPIYFDQIFTQNDLSLIRSARIRYFVVDGRLTQSLPHVGVYFASGETPTPQRLTGAELAKFQDFPGLIRIYDNGPIQIYDASALLGIPSVRGGPGTPGAPLQDGADPFVLVLATILVAIWVRMLISRRPTSESLLRGTVIAMTTAIAATMILVPTGLPAEPIVIVLLALGVVFALPAIAMDRRPIKPKRLKTATALVVAVAITGLSVAIAIGAENIAWQAPAQLSIQRDSTGGWEAAVSLGSGVTAQPRLELTDLGYVVWSSALASGASVQHVVLPSNLVTKSQAVVLTTGGHRVLSVAT
jgi:hypothetical protein